MRTTIRLVWSIALAGLAAHPAAAQFRKAPEYPFTAKPIEIFDRLAQEPKFAPSQMTRAERTLLERAWKSRNALAGPLDERELLDALLFGSGIEDPAKMNVYRDQFAQLVRRAEAAVDKSSSTYSRGEALMSFLHKDVMTKGYSLDQTLWHEVFDSGKYNCVSSTAMVYLVGTRLGLELKPISIPGDAWLAGHATLDLVVDGKRIQVEATNPDGFDWQKKINRPGVIIIGFVPDRKSGYEVDGAGVASMIYSNRAAAIAKSKSADPAREARLLLAALCLDPNNSSAQHNLLGTFTTWGIKLAEVGNFEDSVHISELLIPFAPKHGPLNDNQQIVWHRYVQTLIAAGKDAEAVAVHARAHKAMPRNNDFRGASRAFEEFGERERDRKGWEAALAVGERGTKVLSAEESKKLAKWQTSVLRRWSQSHLDKGEFDASLEVLTQGYRMDPKDRDLAEGVLYHTQESLRRLAKSNDLAAAIRHYRAIVERFPGISTEDNAWSFSLRCVVDLCKQKQFEEAQTAAEALKDIVGPSKRDALGAEVFTLWGNRLADDRQWDAAIEKYQEGLDLYPKYDRLLTNAVATIDKRSRGFIDRRQWDDAIAVYQSGLKIFPNNGHLQNNLNYCIAQKKRAN